MIIFEGSVGAVIGKVNTELIRCLEPRGVVYYHYDPADPRSPKTILDFMLRTPRKGQISLCDRSWYSLMIEKQCDEGSFEALDPMLEVCNKFEKYLVRNGVLLIKIILRATESAVEEYGGQYCSEETGSFLTADSVSPARYREVMFDRLYEATDTEHAPWNKVMMSDVSKTVNETVETIVRIVGERLETEPPVRALPEIDRSYPNPRRSIAEEEYEPYEDTLTELSARLGKLQTELSLSNRSMIICFEGWDAAGKGSCIKHVCHALNPRGYEVFQTKAPTEDELFHTYLWRFFKSIPEKGHITVYDRTWYGRMMVEPVEGFCTEEEYRRSPSEINSLEKMMVNSGVILLKFWLDITPDEQLRRFKKRKKDPLKRWKITDEDWRNREKWGEYEAHIDAMMESTSTDYAPWTVVNANNKKSARVKVLRTVVETLESALGK